MLIKGVTRKGDPVIYTAEEALPFAVLYGLKQGHNGPENIYWVEKDSVVKSSFSKTVIDQKTKDWSATASGTVKIGRTCVKTDKFHVPKNYSFNITYQSSKDEWGIPDIKILSFDLTPIEASVPNIDLTRFAQKKPVKAESVTFAPTGALASRPLGGVQGAHKLQGKKQKSL